MQVVAGALAAVWIGLLWYASALLGERSDAADRVRGMLVLGVFIPFVLAFAHLLYAPVLVVVLVALCIVRRRRDVLLRKRPQKRSPEAATWPERVGPALPLFVAVAVAWPPLVRPLLEGDSLAYHLPNAAAWVQSGSLWETATRYWWYPGGSELFAAGLFAVSGPYSLGIAGTLAVLLLGLRIYGWSRRVGAPALGAGALSAATLGIATIALQAGNLENDVWLGAFFLELLYDARFAPRKLGVDAAVCALIKPVGFLFAIYGIIAARRFDTRLAIPAVVFGAWVVRDAILWSHALIPPGSTTFPNMVGTTIVANGLPAVAELGRALWRDGAWTIVLAVAPILGLFAAKDRALCAAGVAAFVAFLFLPFSYRSFVPQLATGQSLRFAIPAFAVGAVVGVDLLRGAWLVATPLLLIATWLELRHVATIFWIDPHTHPALIVAAAIALASAALRGRERTLAVALLAAVAIVWTNVRAGTDAIARYDESLARPPAHSRFFDWLDRRRPERIVVSDVPAGAIVAVSPKTRTIDVLDTAPCDQARRLRALLLVVVHPPAQKTIIPGAVAQVEHCGADVYRDGVVRVLQPASR